MTKPQKLQRQQKQKSEYIKALLDEGVKIPHNPDELMLPEWVEPGRIKK